MRDAISPALWSAVAGAAVVSVSAGLAAMWSDGGALGWWSWAVVVLLSVPGSLSLLVPAVSMVAASVTVARWKREGAWIGARSVGLSGRRFLPALVLMATLAGLVAACGSLKIEPASRRAVASSLHQAVSNVQLWPGSATALENVILFPKGQDGEWVTDLFFETDEFVGTAKRARMVDVGGVATVELVSGNLIGRGETSFNMTFERWMRPLRLPSDHRLELDQRTNRELIQTASRTESSGRDANYEWAVLYKRFLHPFSVFFLTLGALAAGGSRRVSLSVGMAALGYLVAVRMGDHLNSIVGAGIGASTGLVFSILWAAVVWYRWEDR